MDAQTPLVIDDQEFFLILSIAHDAIDAGLLDAAYELHQRLERIRPDNPHPRIGQALVQYVSGQQAEAIDKLRAVLQDFPDAVFTRSLLAKFLKETGQDGWDRYANETLERVQDGISAEIARDVLGLSQPESNTTTNPAPGATAQGVSSGARPLDVFQGRRA